jgi:hypothetical protein
MSRIKEQRFQVAGKQRDRQKERKKEIADNKNPEQTVIFFKCLQQ